MKRSDIQAARRWLVEAEDVCSNEDADAIHKANTAIPEVKP